MENRSTHVFSHTGPMLAKVVKIMSINKILIISLTSDSRGTMTAFIKHASILKFFLNAEFVVILLEIPHCPAAASFAKKKTQVQMRLASRLLQYRSVSEIQTVCVCSIFTWMHFPCTLRVPLLKWAF